MNVVYDDGIPGLSRERRQFDSDTIRYFLTDEYQTSREILEVMFPGMEDYDMKQRITKFARLAKTMVKHGEVEYIDDFVQGPGCISGKGWRLK